MSKKLKNYPIYFLNKKVNLFLKVCHHKLLSCHVIMLFAKQPAPPLKLPLSADIIKPSYF